MKFTLTKTVLRDGTLFMRAMNISTSRYSAPRPGGENVNFYAVISNLNLESEYFNTRAVAFVIYAQKTASSQPTTYVPFVTVVCVMYC